MTNPKNPGASVDIGQMRGEGALHLRLIEAEKYLKAVLEDYESATEVLRFTQNELTAANQELQNLHQDLSSANEELQRLKREMHAKSLELDRARNELAGILRSAGVGVIVLDIDLRLRHFTPMTGGLIQLRDTDMGKPIREVLPSAEGADVESACQRVLKDLRPQERSLGSSSQRWTLSIRPYRTAEYRVEGVVILVLERS